MKFIYKIMVLSIICLVVNTTHAQIQQYAKDGKNGCIDCEKKSGGRDRCCEFEFDINIFYDFYDQYRRRGRGDEWLDKQEDDLRKEINEKLNADYGKLRDAQHAFFKNHSSVQQFVNTYFEKEYRNQDKVIKSRKLRFDTSYNDIKILLLAKEEDKRLANGQPALYDLGDMHFTFSTTVDLKNLTRLLGTTPDEFTRNKNHAFNTFNFYSQKYKESLRRRDGIDLIKNTRVLENEIADKFIDHYNSFKREDKVGLMMFYLIHWNNGNWLSPNKYPFDVYGVHKHDWESRLTHIVDRANVPMPKNKKPKALSRDESIFEYAIKSGFAFEEMDEKFLDSNLEFREVFKKFLEHNKYKYSSQLGANTTITQYLMKDTATAYQEVYRFVFPDANYPFFDAGTGRPMVLGFVTNKDGVRPNFNFCQYNGFSSVLAELFKNNNISEHFSLEGSFIRAYLIGSKTPFDSSITNEALGRFFSFGYTAYGTAHEGVMPLTLNDTYEGISDAFARQAALTFLEGGTVDFDEQITNTLTGKARCLNNLLTSNGNNFIKNIFSNFRGESEFDIWIKSKDTVISKDGTAVNGKTFHKPGNKFITISINSNSAKGRPSLSVARTLIHEYIHADMTRKIRTSLKSTDISNFKTMINKYEKEIFEGDAQHETMATLYVNSIRDALKDFHKKVLTDDYDKYVKNLGEPTDTFYEALAWQGLKIHNVQAYKDLSKERKDELDRELSNLLYLTDSVCPD